MWFQDLSQVTWDRLLRIVSGKAGSNWTAGTSFMKRYALFKNYCAFSVSAHEFRPLRAKVLQEPQVSQALGHRSGLVSQSAITSPNYALNELYWGRTASSPTTSIQFPMTENTMFPTGKFRKTSRSRNSNPCPNFCSLCSSWATNEVFWP